MHGNYHNYYHRRPVHQRLAVLPEDLFKGKQALDVGCNEGHITVSVAQRGARFVTGVDIDNSLIQSAWRHRIIAWSLSHPSSSSQGVQVQNYFPASLPHELGPLPIPPSTAPGHSKDQFPHNLSFRCADWVREEIPEDKQGYDVVLAFSITKWIHLNQGDDGLLTFFRKIHSVLHEGGQLVLEPQSWESYAKARRMSEKFKGVRQTLQLRPDGFQATLKEIGFEYIGRLGETGEGGYHRPIDLYVKQSATS